MAETNGARPLRAERPDDTAASHGDEEQREHCNDEPLARLGTQRLGEHAQEVQPDRLTDGEQEQDEAGDADPSADRGTREEFAETTPGTIGTAALAGRLPGLRRLSARVPSVGRLIGLFAS